MDRASIKMHETIISHIYIDIYIYIYTFTISEIAKPAMATMNKRQVITSSP